ncbi:MAG: type II secretion system F family protein [Candidatus Margulisbacteria bacterium]|nr:type II secretion system F family protein [Candidatus Margulisiibacteriota bacterium]MBU1617694.1 type II secretion system F family protein [Candidatus Margulisiibacteriota bacterium]
MLSTRQTARLCQQLASLLAAGLPLVSALKVISGTPGFKKEKRSIEGTIGRLEEGEPLYSATCQLLPSLACGAIRGGDRSGRLDVALVYLGNYYNQRADLSEKMVGALVYPAFIVIISLFLLVFLFVFIVPSMGELLGDLGGTLPPLTIAVMTISRLFVDFWMAMVLSLIVFLSVVISKKANIYGELVRLPLIGDFYRNELALLNCLALGMLLEGGVPLAEAILINTDAAIDQTQKADLSLLLKKVENGEKLSEALTGSSFFPRETVSLVAIGENSGQLGKAFIDIASIKAKERGARLEQMAKLLEPAITVIVGGVVAFIVLALFLPLLQLVSALS